MRGLILTVCLLLAGGVSADHPNIYEKGVRMPLDAAYDWVYKALEEQHFYVVFEANMGRNMARFEDRWGEDYNRQGLEGIRSMVACNIWYTNRIASLDPTMLALCPIRITLIHKAGVTRVLFARPSVIGKGSPAEPALKEMEDSIIQGIEQGLE